MKCAHEEGERALRPQAACGKDYAGGGVLAGKLLARPRGQNARRAATSVARAALAKRFRLSLPRRSEEKGCRSTIDARVLARFVRGTMREGVRMDQDLITDSYYAGFRANRIREYRLCTAGEQWRFFAIRARGYYNGPETFDASLLSLRFNCFVVVFFLFLSVFLFFLSLFLSFAWEIFFDASLFFSSRH